MINIERGPDEMVKRATKNAWIKAVGLVLLAFLFVLSMNPEKTHAFNLFNKDGNDGYFLSLTNDPTNVRVVPLTIYDQHHKAQNSKKFKEWVDVEVNYAKYPLNKDLPGVGGGEEGRTNWVEAVYDQSSSVKKMEKDDILAWTFPGFPGSKEAANYHASQMDLDRSQWVADTLVHDFNSAISMVHGAVQSYGDADLDSMSANQFANMIVKIANAGHKANTNGSSSFSYHGVTFSVTKANNVKPIKGLKKGNYVTIKLTKGKKAIPSNYERTLIYSVPKGYRSGQELHSALSGSFKKIVEEKEDPKNLNWKLIVLQSNSNWSANNITYTNVGAITSMNKLEQYVTDGFSNLLTWLRQLLGVYSASELIMNEGVRGTDAYYKGIMPKIWMDSAAILHWISYAIAWMLIIGAIVKLLVQRNVAAINPSERVDMINGIKNLMIVGFALSIFDVVFAGITEINFMIVNMLANSGVGVSNFATAPVGSGTLASVVINVIFFTLDAYFNFFYIARALMIAILYAIGPLYVASIAFGEKYRQIFGNYVREVVGNVFVQSFQAILVVFFVGISLMGGLRTIETLVLLFSFIPMTRFFKESIGASTTASDAMTSTALGATSGAMAGLISSQFLKNRNKNKQGKDNKAIEGGADIQTKSASSYQSGERQSAGSMMAYGAKRASMTGLKTAGSVGLATLGAGLIAGGAATGMHGASQLGGLAMGGAFNMGSSAAKDVGDDAIKAGAIGLKAGKSVAKGAALNIGEKLVNSAAGEFVSGVGGAIAGSTPVQAVKDMKNYASIMANAGVNQLTGGRLFSANPMLNALHNHNIGEFGEGTPEIEDIQTLDDGSSLQTFDKSTFYNKTGISSMRDIDNNGIEMEIGTTFVDGQGFINGDENGLAHSDYERKMFGMVKAFKEKNQAQMESYQALGINSMKIDKDTGRVSFIVDKERAGIGEVFSSGNRIHVQRKVGYGSTDKYASGHANPFSHI